MALSYGGLIYEAQRFPHGSAERGDLLDRAIALADEMADPQRQFQARRQRMAAAIFGAEAELALALFAWCRRMADDRPDLFGRSKLLWEYKFVLTQLPKFARISQAQIDTVATDMAARYEANGNSMRPVFAKRAEAAVRQGRITEARLLWDEAMRHPRDGKADCAACEASFQVELLLRENRFQDLIASAQPILAGTTRCAEVPHTTLPQIMLAHADLRQADDVEALRAESYRLVQRNPGFLEQVSLHIELHVARGSLDEAARIAGRHAPWLAIATNDKTQLHYLRALHCLLDALDKVPARTSAWRTKLLETLEARFSTAPQGASIKARQTALAGSVAAKGLALSAALDQRNGNGFFMRAWNAPPFSAVA